MSAVRVALLFLFATLGTDAITVPISNATRTTASLPPSSSTFATTPTSPLLDESEEDLRERFRRLIPYMTYYVMNNYVSAGASQRPEAPILRRPTSSSPASTRYVTLRPVTNSAGKNRFTVAPHPPKDNRFVPSVQYNPKDVGPDADYFVPVRYSAKEQYDDYPMITVRPPRPMSVTIQDPRFITTIRPPVSYAPQKIRPQSPTRLQQQLQDYNVYSQEPAPEEFESVRFSATPAPPPQQQHRVQYVQTVAPRPTILEPVQGRVDLHQVLKSLQLTNQLPEVLNKDNIDSSIKTLMEILNILNMSKKESYTPAPEQYTPIYTKPKVITESNYEASQFSVTPHQGLVELKPSRPIYHPVNVAPPPLQEEQEQHLDELKPVNRPYFTKIKTQTPPPPTEDIIELHPVINTYSSQVKQPQSEFDEQIVEIKPKNPYAGHRVTSQTPAPLQTTTGDKKIIEYYVPIIQDIDDEKVYTTAMKKPSTAPSTEHSPINNSPATYNVDEHPDEILEDERYTIPTSTLEPPTKLSPLVPSIPPSLKYGATRGKPHVDYPAYTEIPETPFSCKEQRYKGFFGDPDTGCQVWHYCDLNGGKSSFLCPNGTIFSQVALTCDWWFNVKCESTTQLYVLNERLYKYILPIMPKFPEDFTGPEVDKYLELKFKEMEDKLQEKKEKKEEDEQDKSTLNTLQSIEDSK